MNRSLKKYYISVAIGIAIFILVSTSRELFTELPLYQTVMILSDSCFIPGVVLAGIGGLSWAASRGGYDILGFAVSTLKSHFNHTKDYRSESFYDYKIRKNKMRKAWFREALIVGVILIALSAVFMVWYLLI